jgi:hypothetical protein
MHVAGSREDRNAACGYLLHQGLIAKRPFRLAKDDNRDSHRVETELGLRRMEQASGRGPI